MFIYVLLVVWAACAAGAPVYVSLNGNDLWSGLLPSPNSQQSDGPVLSFARAQKLVQQQPYLRSVVVRGGTYYINQTLTLTKWDNGTTWMAFPGENVILTGGQSVTGWNKDLDSYTASRLSDAARPNVYQADLKSLGISTFTMPSISFSNSTAAIPGMELFFNGKTMIMARYPNINVSDPNSYNYTFTGPSANQTGPDFQYLASDAARINSWSLDNPVYVHGYFMYDWYDTIAQVAELKPNNTISCVAPPAGYGFDKNGGNRYFFFNVLEELDAPGEYYINRTTGVMYFWPPSPLTDSKSASHVSIFGGYVFAIQSTSDVTIQGFTIQHLQGTAIYSQLSTAVTIRNLNIRGVGNQAITLQSTTQANITDCSISYTGLTAISLTGGDRKTLTRSNSSITFCDIFNVGRYLHAVIQAIHVLGCGHTISNNHIYNSPKIAINAGAGQSNFITIEYNEIDHVVVDTSDAGGIYIGRDWTAQGTLCRYNYMHDIIGMGDLAATAIYFDDQNSGNLAISNIFVNVWRGVKLGGGRDSTIQDNLFIDCKTSVFTDARGFTTTSNNATLFARYLAMPTTTAPWNTTFPHLPYLLSDNPHAPKYNVIQGNIYVNSSSAVVPTLSRPYLNASEFNYTFTINDFVNISGHKFQIKPTSPANNFNFPPIPFEKIGNTHSSDPSDAPTTTTTTATTSTPTTSTLTTGVPGASGTSSTGFEVSTTTTSSTSTGTLLTVFHSLVFVAILFL